METKTNEILEYLIKFVDEDVCVWSNSSNECVIGQCVQLKPDDVDSNHLVMVIVDVKNEEHVYDIWEYDYKTSSWYDGLRKADFCIKHV